MSSCHHKNVHRWPRDGLIRLARHSISSHVFEQAKIHYLGDLCRNLEASRLADVALFNPYKQNSLRSSVASKVSSKYDNMANRDNIIITLVLDYHPSWNLMNLQVTIDSFMDKHTDFCKFFWRKHVHVRVAWRNRQPSLALVLRKLG